MSFVFFIVFYRFLLTHLMRGATYAPTGRTEADTFLLTHLMRGATFICIYYTTYLFISTHTPHARCDFYLHILYHILVHFYSHTSCEVRLSGLETPTTAINISTHTPHARCDTAAFFPIHDKSDISTHTPHARCDPLILSPFPVIIFLLTHLMRGATFCISHIFSVCKFLLTHLMRGAT